MTDWLDPADRSDYYDAQAEAREEARRETAHDRFLDRAVTCADCGELWDPRVHPATRTDPSYVEVDECPYCGGQAEEWMTREELERYREESRAED